MVALPPVAEREADIRRSVDQNAVTIVTADPGAWKSTLIPQYLIDFGRLVFAQPRTLAAISITERIASLRNEEVGDTFAWRVSKRGSRNWRNAKALLCTDGYITVRELFGTGSNFGQGNGFDVLGVDELHEWNRFQEVLVALARDRLRKDPSAFKFVTMSATLEAEDLRNWFQKGGVSANVIHVEGRSFPVTELPRGASIEDDAEKFLRMGKNVLIFQPTVKTIEQTIAELKSRGIDAEILPLHSKLNSNQQKRCFEEFDRPKCIVATNVAQTSITIPGIQVVIDSGLELRREVVNGIVGLHIRAISLKDREQRKGRAGRTEIGLFIDHCPFEERSKWPKPEFERELLDQLFLQLLECGVSPAELEFFHQPSEEVFSEAIRRPTMLGCIDTAGKVTEIGKKVSRLPMSVPVSRMFVAAEERGVTEDILLFEALREIGGVVQRKANTWQNLLDGAQPSDITAQISVYRAALNMQTGEERSECGIDLANFRQVRSRFQWLKDELKGKVRLRSSGGPMDVVAAVCSGMIENLWHRGKEGRYFRPGSTPRMLERSSVVKDAEWVIAFPDDITFGEMDNRQTHFVLRWVTKIDPRWISIYAPSLLKTEDVDLVYEPKTDSVSGVRRKLIGPHVLSEETFCEFAYSEAAIPFADWLLGDWQSAVPPETSLWEVLEANRTIRREAGHQALAGGDTYPFVEREAYLEWLIEKLAGARRLSEIEDVETLRLPSPYRAERKSILPPWLTRLFRPRR